MSSIKEEAKLAKAMTTQNISDLDKVDINLELTEEEHTDDKGKMFKIKVAMINEVRYRVPTSVLLQLKELLKVRPEMQFFQVIKTGVGMNTKYQVIQAE